MKLFFGVSHFCTLSILLLSLLLSISTKASRLFPIQNPPAEDSVLDYVKIIYDEAGNLESSELVYKKNPTPKRDSVSNRQSDTLVPVESTDVINDASLGMDEKRYLDSIAKMIYVFPNPNSTGVLTIKWDTNIRSLMKDFVISPYWSAGGNTIQHVLPMSGRDEVAITMHSGVSGLYIVECRLTNGKVLKIKLIRN